MCLTTFLFFTSFLILDQRGSGEGKAEVTANLEGVVTANIVDNKSVPPTTTLEVDDLIIVDDGNGVKRVNGSLEVGDVFQEKVDKGSIQGRISFQSPTFRGMENLNDLGVGG